MKSGAGLPTCKVPARARNQSVSKGNIKKGTGPGILAITLPNCSGDSRITPKNATQHITHSVAITQNETTAALINLDCAFTRLAIEPQKEVRRL